MTYFLNPTKTPHSFLERAFRLSLNVFTHLRGLLSAVTSVAFSHLCSFCIKNSKRTWCECSLNQGWVCEYREDDSCTACWDYSNMLLEYSPVSKAIQSRTGERDGFFFLSPVWTKYWSSGAVLNQQQQLRICCWNRSKNTTKRHKTTTKWLLRWLQRYTKQPKRDANSYSETSKCKMTKMRSNCKETQNDYKQCGHSVTPVVIVCLMQFGCLALVWERWVVFSTRLCPQHNTIQYNTSGQGLNQQNCTLYTTWWKQPAAWLSFVIHFKQNSYMSLHLYGIYRA